MNKWFHTILAGAALMLSLAAVAQTDFTIYTNSLQNGWQNWSWATVNFNNTSPAYGGSGNSIKVDAGSFQGLYFSHPAFDTSSYASVSFRIHGGTSGNQQLNVAGLLDGTAQTAVAINPRPTANNWSLVTIPLSSLGIANKTNCTGFWIQNATGSTLPTYYVDDVKFVAQAAPSNVAINVNAAQIKQTVDNRMFGINAVIWDDQFNNGTTQTLLQQADTRTMRFPGGSLSDEYHWQTNTSRNNTWQWATSFDEFASVAKPLNTQVFITVNYGSGTPQEAANWVQYSNVTKNYGFKYWEIGNENYGSWEYDLQTRPNDPYIYATRAKDYIQQMKAKDPTIKVGVVMDRDESSSSTYTDHPATNPRTGQVFNGWNPVMLTRLAALGVTPDFVIYHKYNQGPGGENDAALLNSSTSWAADIAVLRQQLNDYLGTTTAANVEICCTENNSVYSNPGKQTTSLVNGLFYADSIGQALQTELKSFVWWDIRNGQDSANNNSASLYGWRNYGDYGIMGGNDTYPTYYAHKMMKYFARGGDQIVSANTDNALLAAYASKRSDGSLSLMVINKSSSNTITGNISLSGYTPTANATVYSYGIPQDEAARTGVGSRDIAQSSISNAASAFNYAFPPYSITTLSLFQAPSNVTLTGTVKLASWVGGGTPLGSIPVSVSVDGGAQTVNLTGSNGVGNFTVQVPATGTHSILVKPRAYLSQRISITTSGSNVGANFFGPDNVTGMLGGDTDNNNVINDFDLANIIFDFGAPPSGNNGTTDTNASGQVDDFDLANVIFNFGKVGDN